MYDGDNNNKESAVWGLFAQCDRAMQAGHLPCIIKINDAEGDDCLMVDSLPIVGPMVGDSMKFARLACIVADHVRDEALKIPGVTLS